MSGEITSDGRVIAPLNITAPTPLLNLRGFQWGTVNDVRSPQPDDVKQHDDKNKPEVQAFMAVDSVPSRREATTPVTPAAASEAKSLPVQLTTQLGLDVPKPPPALDFPLSLFQGAWAGNGFNLIFRPRSNHDTKSLVPPPSGNETGPNDNILELNLTTEQLTFGPTLGKIPNRGLGNQPDIDLAGLPYLQTVQDVTKRQAGDADFKATPIHFEPGVWLLVPPAKFQTKASVVRMASIPHGTTINAQGLVPERIKTAGSVLGGVRGRPNFDVIDTTPFDIGDPVNGRKVGIFKSMNADNQQTFRIPMNLEPFKANGTITTPIIKNPNLVLENAIKPFEVLENFSFEVSTGPTAELNGGGTANIAFLAGKQATITSEPPGKTDSPNAHAAFMMSKFWIERVAYEVNVPPMAAGATRELKPEMPDKTTAPTPQFLIKAPAGGNATTKKIKVPGLQIQSSQTVNLNFGPPVAPHLTWPHVSVATLVPTGLQTFQMS